MEWETWMWSDTPVERGRRECGVAKDVEWGGGLWGVRS